jgi:hypothetical protein
MYDLNFFTILRKQKDKNKNVKIVGICILALLVILNGVLVGIGLLAFNKLETQIATNVDYINSPVTKAKVKDVEILSKEKSIAGNYLLIIKEAAVQIEQKNLITVKLIDFVRGIAPEKTFFRRAEYDGMTINLDCFSTEIMDPMSYYHRLLQEDRFADVSMPGFIVSEDGTIIFSIKLTLKGGVTS